MLVKLINGEPQVYSIYKLKSENPNTSFPNIITDEILSQYNLHRVKTTERPDFNSETHTITDDLQLINDEWTQIWNVVPLPEETASNNIREIRNNLLKETDWMALSDVTMTEEWKIYRQQLRDISQQQGFPYSVEWPNRPL